MRLPRGPVKASSAVDRFHLLPRTAEKVRWAAKLEVNSQRAAPRRSRAGRPPLRGRRPGRSASVPASAGPLGVGTSEQARIGHLELLADGLPEMIEELPPGFALRVEVRP